MQVCSSSDERVHEGEERPTERHSILQHVLEAGVNWHWRVCHSPLVEEAEASKLELGVVDEDAVAVSMNPKLHTAHYNFAAAVHTLLVVCVIAARGHKDCSQSKPRNLGRTVAVALGQ